MNGLLPSLYAASTREGVERVRGVVHRVGGVRIVPDPRTVRVRLGFQADASQILPANDDDTGATVARESMMSC